MEYGEKRPPISEEMKKHLSAMLKGVKKPPRSTEHGENLSRALTGRVSAFKGKQHSVAAREKMSQLHMGKKHSKETLEKQSLAKKGKKTGPFSEERRRGLSLSAKKGEESHMWRGGLTSINKIIRASMESKLWREAVFKRDDYRCMDCGERGGKLHADHIYPFAHFSRLRFDINNGQTLCVDCHKRTPTYGHKAKNYQLTN